MSTLKKLLASPPGRRAAWLVAFVWLLLTAVAAPLGSMIADVENNEAASWLPRSAESTRYEQLRPRFESADVASAVVVFTRESGLTARDRAFVERNRERFAGYAVGRRVDAAVESPHKDAALLAVPLDANDDDLLDVVTAMRAQIRDDRPSGLEVAVTGEAGSMTDQFEVFDDLDVKLLLISAVVVAILLLLTYRSPVLWLLPLFSVAVACQVAQAAVYLLGRYADLPVNAQSGGILPVLVFGIGTDYALLLIARYREELHRHRDRFAAMRVAIRRAGPAIVASAATVAVGLSCLLVAELNSNRSLGGVGAVGVVCGVVAMTTLLPALLVLCGRWVFWPFIPRFGTPTTDTGVWTRLGAVVGRSPRLVWAATLVLLGALVLGMGGMQMGLTQEQSFRDTPESVTGQRLVGEHFAAGASQPAEVVARYDARAEVVAVIEATRGVDHVEEPTRSHDGRWTRVAVVLRDAPDSDAAERTVDRLRDRLHRLAGADAVVGGPTAVTVDIERASARDRRVVIPLVLVVVLVILALLLRAVVAPVLLVGTVVLSYLAALGGTALLAEHLFGMEGTDQSLPLLGFVFLVALGVDYNIFLMTRVREEAVRHGHRRGVLIGLATTGGVITSAGLVLAATFAVMITTPVVPLVSMGLLVAFGVLLDTFVVRSVLVPALALDLGQRTWWPGGGALEP